MDHVAPLSIQSQLVFVLLVLEFAYHFRSQQLQRRTQLSNAAVTLILVIQHRHAYVDKTTPSKIRSHITLNSSYTKVMTPQILFHVFLLHQRVDACEDTSFTNERKALAAGLLTVGGRC